MDNQKLYSVDEMKEELNKLFEKISSEKIVAYITNKDMHIDNKHYVKIEMFFTVCE